MNLHNVTPLPTGFQIQNAMRAADDALAKAAFERGQESGLWLARRAADKALGAGGCIGFALGFMAAVLIREWIQ